MLLFSKNCNVNGKLILLLIITFDFKIYFLATTMKLSNHLHQITNHRTSLHSPMEYNGQVHYK